MMRSLRRGATLLDDARAAVDMAVLLVRLTRDAPRFLREPLTPEAARWQFLERIATRERRLLQVVEQTVYGNPRSPYRALLRHAGCEPGDFRGLVAREGIDGALRELADRGVYVQYDEMKGRRELVRGSLRLRLHEAAFDNPRLQAHYALYSGGSGGRPSRVPFSLGGLQERGAALRMVFEAHGALQPHILFWWPMPLSHLLLCEILSMTVNGWYYPVHPLPPRVRLAAWYLRALGLMTGRRLARPERCDLSQPERIARLLAEQLLRGESAVLWTMASAGVRVGAAAARLGLDLRGALFLLSGEPVTDARRAQIEAAGARVLVQYSSVEAPTLALGCAAPAATDDVHVMLDRYALVQRRRSTVTDGPDVDALMVTSLTPTLGRVLLNTELGDYGHLEQRTCGCQLGALGLQTHVSGIRSFEKLTSEGVTFARSNLELVVEQILPARFGGTSLDYQIAEEEGPAGAARLVLRVHPAVGNVDEAAVRRVVLEALGRPGPVEQYHARIWQLAGTVEVRREPPLTTRAGKAFAFQRRKATPT